MTQLKDGGRQPSNREERPLSASTVIARWQGNGEPCKSRGLRTVLWAAGGEIPPADPADELDRARQDAGLWREEADRERVRIANLQADAEHIEQEMARLQAELEQARRPWWRRLVGR